MFLDEFMISLLFVVVTYILIIDVFKGQVEACLEFCIKARLLKKRL